MRTTIAFGLLLIIPPASSAQDADGDGLSDALEATLGMDPQRADTFEPLHDDKSRDEGDANIGRENERAGDFTRISFCVAGRDRYVWRVEFAEPWIERDSVATILYMDADNDRDTGRRDKEWAFGIDMMLRPNGVAMFEWPGSVKTASAHEENVLYLVADIRLNQQDGKSVYRWTLLTQDTGEGRERDQDTMSFVDTSAAGRTDRPRVAVEPSHALYHPPKVISDLAARMIPEAPDPTAEVTWVTSWPCDSRVEFGPTKALGADLQAPPGMQNHRVLVSVEPNARYYFRVVCLSEDGDQKATEVIQLETRPPRARGSVKRDDIPLTITNQTPALIVQAPFIIGVPFPQRALGGVEQLRVMQGNRQLVSQAECAARWPDGTVRWALVQFLADCPADREAEVLLRYGSGLGPKPAAPPPMIEGGADLLVITTGPLEAVIDRRDFNLFRSLSLDRDRDGKFADDEELIGTQAPGGLYLVDADGNEYRSAEPEEVTVEENGPVRAVIKVRGHHIADDGSELFEYIVRLMFYRGQGLVRILHTFGNDRVEERLTDIAQMGIRLPVECSNEAKWTIAGTIEDQGDGITFRGLTVGGDGSRLELRQMHHDHFVLTADAAEEIEGREATGVGLEDSDLQLHIDLADFGEQYPKGWHVENDVLDIQLCPRLDGGQYADADPVTSDRLYYYLRDGAYRFHRGVSKTHEIRMHLGARGKVYEEFAGLRRHDPLNCYAPAEWYAQSGAAGLMLPRVEGEFDEYEAFVERNFEASQKRREEIGEYGMLNFGDWWGERGYNWGNVEYDTENVMLMEYLRTLDPKFLKRGCEAALHNRDVDGIHYAANPRSVGQVHVHCMFHTGGYEVTGEQGIAMPNGGFNWGHVWTRGLLDHYFITGDRRSRDWALTVADHLAGPMTVGFSVGNHAERDTAWPIFGVMAAYEATTDPYYLNAAKLMIEDVIRRQNPETGNWGFPAGYSKVEPKPIGGYAWCCGLLITSLDLYNQYVHDPRVEQVIVRAARWLVRDEWIPEKRGFRATSCPTFNESTPAGGACWSCSNAMLIAHELTGEQQFLDIAHSGFSAYMERTQSMGKGVTQSICLAPETLYRFKQAGITSLDPTPYEPPGQTSIPRHIVLWPGEPARLSVVLRSNRDEPIRAQVSVAATDAAKVEPGARDAELNGDGDEARLAFEIAQAEAPEHVSVRWRIDTLTGEQSVKLVRPEVAQVGEKVGLIASGEDFLGSALDALDVEYERLESLDEIGEHRALMLGTQAHSINTLGLLEEYWRLFAWVRAGGRLLCSQLNDTGWNRFFLPHELVVLEADGESGAVAAREHPIFTQPHTIEDVSGVWMYDTLAVPDGAPWTVLLRDAGGGPAVIEASFGKG